MSDAKMNGTAAARPNPRPNLSQQWIRRRYAAERRFRLYGLLAVAAAIAMLAVLLVSIVGRGYSAFYQTQVSLDVFLDPAEIAADGRTDADTLMGANYMALVRESLRGIFPEVTGRTERRDLNRLISNSAGDVVRTAVMDDPSLIGQTIRLTFPLDDKIGMLHKGFIDRNLPESERVVSDREIAWYDRLVSEGLVSTGLNWNFLSKGDSREPEQAGILGAFMGSMFTMLVTIVLALPLGVMSAIYLEEFAPKNRVTELIEVNINNLAAVPSIVFGLLGLAVLLGVFGMPRSAPLVGGVVLSLMTLPTVIIATRAALKAVPPSIREAAYGVGASPLQVVLHHVLPLATPGIMTGAIIGLARALGESAPLLMIGMVAFIVDVPGAVTDPATVLPVQIYLWADSPERAFIEKTSAGIMVLLAFLITMNAIAIFVRRRFERRW
ncbi:phosphate ABC transporter membrane protein 2 (PhoT family) [Dongia mobilis]|uniref:Phosphate transport system permease protein PstA n=1 Tax=Dongia mobilis TaxID=578943 RepID=A0A4R6WWH0_9PROT|nr:phosphate ABC transporter permease PstA [Dongia mobilis]TDQ86443.1 phosphate ABC transporter membrane protein 2 (PhoT family) [Dongia mobilis]